MSFTRITGNRVALKRLEKLVASGRIPPSLLFSGPEGAGKLRAAVAFAKALNCPHAQDGAGDACDACPSCARIERGTHPDVRCIGPEGPGGQLKADAVRQVVTESPFRPFEGKKRVYIFETADRMNPTAANTLLKTLEEPPPWTVLVLLTANEAAILPTLLSRCQKIRFLPLQLQEAVDLLVAQHGTPPETARAAASVAGGNVSRALAIAGEIETLQDEAFRIASLPATEGSRSQVLSWADRLAKSSQLPLILRLAACRLRDLASVAAGGSALHSEASGELEDAARRAPLSVWLECYLELEEAIGDLETRYTNKRITLEQTLLTLRRLGEKGPARSRRTIA